MKRVNTERFITEKQIEKVIELCHTLQETCGQSVTIRFGILEMIRLEYIGGPDIDSKFIVYFNGDPLCVLGSIDELRTHQEIVKMTILTKDDDDDDDDDDRGECDDDEDDD